MNFKKDNLLFGIILGTILPLVVYFILEFAFKASGNQNSIRQSTQELIAIVVVIPLFRYYIINLKAENTGKGLMLVLFAYALYFAFRHFAII